MKWCPGGPNPSAASAAGLEPKKHVELFVVGPTILLSQRKCTSRLLLAYVATLSQCCACTGPVAFHWSPESLQLPSWGVTGVHCQQNVDGGMTQPDNHPTNHPPSTPPEGCHFKDTTDIGWKYIHSEHKHTIRCTECEMDGPEHFQRNTQVQALIEQDQKITPMHTSGTSANASANLWGPRARVTCGA